MSKNWNLLIHNIKDYAIFMVDPAGRIETWNRGAETIKGYRGEEVIGQPIDIFYTAEDLDRHLPADNLKMAEQCGSYHLEGWRVRKDGTRFWADITITALYDDDHRLEGFTKITRDMSRQIDKKTAELREVFERVTDAFMAYDAEGNIVYLNSRAKVLMNTVGISDTGRNIFREFPIAAESVFGQHFRKAMETQKDQHYEHFSAVLNRWLESHMYPSPNGISQFFRDITPDKELREQLQQSNAELHALASHLQDVREAERASIAREIHDELGQQLTGLKMDLYWAEEKPAIRNDPALREKLFDTQSLLDHAIATVRKIATELRPGILDDLGLVAAVEWQAGEFERRSGILTRFRAGMVSRRYPSAMSIGMFRICQEALTNVARHANAKTVEIFLGYEEDRIVLRITDDGQGLSVDPAGGKRKTLGLLGMKERAQMMGGTLAIDSQPGKGTILTASIPLSVSETD